MNHEHEKITPATARQWLESVPDFQRRVNPAQVDKLALAIQRDEWRENGSTIVFNNKGELIDGQHRCHAIVQANRAVWSLVVRGVSATEDTFSSIDDMVPRNASHFLRCENSATVAATGKLLWHMLNEDFPYMSKKPPITDLLHHIRPYIEVLNDGIIQRCWRAGKVVGHGSFLTFLALYYKHIKPIDDPNRINEFMDRVGDGVGLHPGSPVLALRNRFALRNTNERIILTVARALIIKALHAYLDGRQMSKIAFDPGKEKFPELR